MAHPNAGPPGFPPSLRRIRKSASPRTRRSIISPIRSCDGSRARSCAALSEARPGITNNFRRSSETISSRGEFCPSYLYSEEAADRIAAYRPDIKLLLCLRPPVEMIYSWYWYNRNAVVASLPDTFEEHDGKSISARSRMLRPPSQAISRSLSGGEFSRRFNSTRSGALLTRPPSASMNFWASPQTSNRSSRSRERTPPGLLAFPSSIQRPASLRRPLRAPGRRQTPEIARRRENAAKRLPPASTPRPASTSHSRSQERLKWEAYYAADQKELSELLNALQVIE